jgi:hypothetical protein
MDKVSIYTLVSSLGLTSSLCVCLIQKQPEKPKGNLPFGSWHPGGSGTSFLGTAARKQYKDLGLEAM